MDTATEQTVNAVADGVVTATDMIAPALGPSGAIVDAAMHAARALVSFLVQLGHGDAVKEMLDTELAAGRQKTDEALAAKHAHDLATP